MMKTISKIIKYVIDRDYRFCINSYYGLYHNMDDEKFLKRKYKIYFKKELDLENPRTFNEKMQWLKLYDHNEIYTELVDKYTVKDYIKQKIGNEYIIPTLGVWNDFESIDFDELPKKFVLKCTHDSGGIYIVKDKDSMNLKEAEKKIKKSLKRKYYYAHREWPYKNVKPRIIAEKYLENKDKMEINDYKLMCFNGEVKCSFVCSDRFNGKGLKVTFFDNDWNVMPFERHYPKSSDVIPKPVKYDEMVKLAEKLSEGIPFVRVDFYEVDKEIYFGEMTFYPGSGFEEFNPEEWDVILGSWIELPKNKCF